MTQHAITVSPDSTFTVEDIDSPAAAAATAARDAVAELDPADPIRVAVEALTAALTS